MKESTKALFLRPFIFQETITALVVVPMLLFFFLNVSEGVKNHFLTTALGGMNAANLGLALGFLVKYLLVRPARDLMDKESWEPHELKRALRSVSLLPLMESITIFLRFALFGNLIAVMPVYLKGYVTLSETYAGLNALVMTGLLSMPFFYLAAENSLVPFYQKCGLQGVLDGKERLFRLSLNQKLLATVLLIAIPPIGLILGTIYLSVVSGLNLVSMKFGFVILLLQTTLLTFINGLLLMKSLSMSVGRMSLMFQDMAKGQGDLTKRLYVTGLNEVGELAYWFNRFMDDIERIIGHVRETSMQLHLAIEDVSAGSIGLSQSTQEQAASVEQISASIEEMNGTVRHNGDLIRGGKRARTPSRSSLPRASRSFPTSSGPSRGYR